MKLPNTAYILLWFPKPSETFVFSEVQNLLGLGLPISIYTLYGKLARNLSCEMQSFNGTVLRLGLSKACIPLFFIFYWFFKSPATTTHLITHLLFTRWKGLEKTAENAWACYCAFYLAYRFQADNIKHIHAPWACGCASAAWFASRLTGIPFSFTMRAWDIHPPDGLIREKTRAALFIRSETQYNIDHLQKYTGCTEEKFHLTYNGVPMTEGNERTVPLVPPYQLLAVGRIVGKKGYEFLLRACAILQDQSIPFHLHIVGDGLLLVRLKRLSNSLRLKPHVTFHGYQPYDKIPKYFEKSDIFIMPSIIDSSGDRDGIPTVLLESLLHHVPVISTSVSGIPELIEDGVTGLLVRQKDPAALADAILQHITRKEQAITMARNGHKKVLDLFNAEKNHAKVLTLYTTYLGER